ncbi:MAG: helix-turn-helix transcriptional regulator [Burkholderiales bacterium]|nr:helix-turn-helix transcriptional regulator [Burkholderiales bacterium]
MTIRELNSQQALINWFHQSGVRDPLTTCIGPLPQTRAALGRWSCSEPDEHIHTNIPHPDSYRIAVMLAPLEARIWEGNSPIWGGMIAANRFRICPPGESGRWRRLSACDIVNIFIPIALVDHYAELRGDFHERLSTTSFTQDRQVLNLVHMMLDADILAGSLATQVRENAMSILVSYLLEHYSQRQPQTGNKEENSSLSGARLRRVLMVMSQHMHAPLSNAEMASICAMSEAHFSREFRRAMGTPPHQYLMRLRLEQASQALLKDDSRIVDIACDYGFNNASHFSRSFTAQYGVPPAIYRTQRRTACVDPRS